MSLTRIPYQRLQISGKTLVAARGSSIDTFDLSDGSFHATWSTASKKTPKELVNVSQESSSPPAKRRKVTEQESVKDEKSEGLEIEKQVKEASGQSVKDKKKQPQPKSRAESAATGLENPAVICMAATDDGKYIVIVTAEDKSIRVLECTTSEHGKSSLNEISSRQMSKRPCAIMLSADDKTIVSADKFGDVYTLPLIPPREDETTTNSLKNPTPEPTKVWQPAANEFTIHSKRNRNALEQQRRHKTQPNAAERTNFAGTLILGHVSMLTDLIWGHSNGKEYIITADRDEHIRVTRGGDQTYVIEQFCLGHEDIVTRLCIPHTAPELLISGGGENEIFTWDWKNGILLTKTDLHHHVATFLKSVTSQGTEPQVFDLSSIVVSSINHVQTYATPDSNDVVVVTVEGVAALFVFYLTKEPMVSLNFMQSLALKGNPLDVLVYAPPGSKNSPTLVLSIDTLHEACSKEKRHSGESTKQALAMFEVRGESVQETSEVTFDLNIDELATTAVDPAKLSLLLYPLESLRKREGEDKDE